MSASTENPFRAAEQGINENEALEKGSEATADPSGRERGQRLSQFVEKGAEVYAKA
jgi:hypothetical protein